MIPWALLGLGRPRLKGANVPGDSFLCWIKELQTEKTFAPQIREHTAGARE